MKLTNPKLREGYNPITKMEDFDWDDPKNTKMDFGILRLKGGDSYTLDNENEKAVLLMTGSVTLKWNDESVEASRKSIFDDDPCALLVPRNTNIEIQVSESCKSAELCLLQTIGDNDFTPRFFPPEECLTEQFGKGTLRETSTRDVRTIFDANNMPESNLVLGEVINYPGKWSSYPPHGHDQPEIYHYRFLPEKGFGFGMDGYDEVKILRNGDTLAIINGAPHSQTSAPGYAMYYIWAIRHLKDNPYGPEDPRKFVPSHTWVMDPGNNKKIWPPEK